MITEEEKLISDPNISQLFDTSDEKIDFDIKSIIYDDENYTKKLNNTILEEEKIESQIDSRISNVGKNTTSIFKGLGEIGLTVLKALPTAGEITAETGGIATRAGISIGLKAASWVLLPVTCLGFAIWFTLRLIRL